MTCNMGTADRVIRIVVGIALVVFGFIVGDTFGLVMSTIGLIPLATGSIGNCPVYSLLKINGCRSNTHKGI